MSGQKGPRGLVKHLLELPPWLRLLLAALATAIPFYFAAFLGESVARAAAIGRPLALGVHAAVFIVLLTVVVLTAKYIEYVREDTARQEQAMVAMKLHAYAHLDRLVVKAVRRVAEGYATPADFRDKFVASKDDLQELVEAAYSAFEAGYGKAARTEDRIDFEVTFMTKSYSDGLITIPACSNRDGRSPRSMILRKQKPDVYEPTVTAAVYREERPAIHIVPDTGAPGVRYEELYAGQVRRIQSTIIFPVLSNSNELLGTLVVHCDKRGFFQHGDEKYWTDLLEIFAKRLALVKLKLDALVSSTTPITVPPVSTPF